MMDISLKKHMNFLENIYKFTGQAVNKAKLCYATGRINGSKDIIIKSIIGFQKQTCLCPTWDVLFTREEQIKSILFLSLIKKLQIKLGAWKGKILSLEAKLILIRYVLQALPSYLLALIQPPKSFISAINKLMFDFFGIRMVKKKVSLGEMVIHMFPTK